jgi:hypothetical protein
LGSKNCSMNEPIAASRSGDAVEGGSSDSAIDPVRRRG